MQDGLAFAAINPPRRFAGDTLLPDPARAPYASTRRPHASTWMIGLVHALPSPALVIGASGGIGGALLSALTARGVSASGLSRRDGLDLGDGASIAAALAAIPEPPRLVLVATGLLHAGDLAPEKSIAALDPAHLARSFAINAIGPALVAKHLLPRMPRVGRSIFAVLSARVGSIADNRLGGWYGYRASKAALNQLVRTAAIEQSRRAPESVVVALHPGTVATKLSAPFCGGAHRVFTTAEAAEHLLVVLADLTPAASGGLFAWDGSAIPF